MIDLILCKDKFDNLGFSKVYEIKINRVNSINQIRKLNDELNIIEGNNLNREILTCKNIDILASPEKNRKEDFLHHRNSGLNQVLCKLMEENKITYGINLSLIINNKNLKAFIGRISQNIKLCRKYKIRMMLASFAKDKFEMRNPKDALALLKVIGMTQKEANNALNWEKEDCRRIKLIK